MESIILADVLEAAGLGGPEPIRAARALLATLRQQPGGDNPDHQAAHGAMVVRMVRGMPVLSVRGMIGDGPPDAAMLLLARLVLAGVPAAEILEYLPERKARAA